MDLNRERPEENLGIWYHELSKDPTMGGRIKIPADISLWPESWKTTEYKTYKNFKRIFLKKPKECFLDNKLSEVIFSRKSDRKYNGGIYEISLDELSKFISNTIAESGRVYSQEEKSLHENFISKYRVYPSGGGRFPLEFYFLVKYAKDIQPGLYHYNVSEHSLEFLQDLETLEKEGEVIHFYSWANHASVHVFTTAVVDRVYRKYGERGYRYLLLEAGVVLQNFYLVGTALKLSTVAVAGVYNKNVENILHIDGKSETLIQTFLLG
jgi:SagB-type dehydrogenase family enzyme